MTSSKQWLRKLQPILQDVFFVFCTMKNAKYGDYRNLQPMASFMEQEGLTLVIPKTQADQHNIPYEEVFKCISLHLFSSLTDVGLTAAISSKLAAHNISANIIAGFYHDHVFVPQKDAKKAYDLLSSEGERTLQEGRAT